MDRSDDAELGVGVFVWTGLPPVQIFERGFTYGESPRLKMRYEEITGLELLDLRSLMNAQKVPDQLVEFAVLADKHRYVLRVPLILYATLSGVLNKVLTVEK